MGRVVFVLAASPFIAGAGCVGLQDLGPTASDASVNMPDGALALERDTTGYMRGGSFVSPPKKIEANFSARVNAYSANTSVGFRCAKTKL